MLKYLCLILLVLSVNSQAQGADFFSVLDDIPIMQGLTELPEEALIFDKPDGRIVHTAARLNTLSFQTVSSFYEEVLPQLGWMKGDNDRYIREGEVLTLSFQRDGIINFRLKPL